MALTAYCTVANVQLNLAGFEFDTIPDSDTNLSDAQVELFIAKADAYINSIIANVYTLPFTVTIPLLIDISTDLTCYYILRRNYTRNSIEMSEWVEQFLKDFNKKMDDIKNNKISLVDTVGTVVVFGSSLIQHNNEDYTPTCDMGDSDNWRVDPDRLADIADAK